MKSKKKIFAIMTLVAILGVSSYATFSRYATKISKEGSINTADVSYCQSKGITSLKECLIRNDSQKELTEALNAIDERSQNVNFNAVEPVHAYIPTVKYTDITDKTSDEAIKSTTAKRHRYIIVDRLLTEEDIMEGNVPNITFDKETGYYKFIGEIKDGTLDEIVTTKENMEKGIYKYTGLNPTTEEWSSIYLITESPVEVNNYYRVKQGYTYSHKVTGTSASRPGLYKGEDDYTVDNNTHTYYYRGEVNNNWVKFGDYLWRVIRINGNGSIRMIYSGLASSTSHKGANSAIISAPFADSTTYEVNVDDISGLTNDKINVKYQNSRYANTYVGYMYNPAMVYSVYPNKEVNENNLLNTFPNFQNANDARTYYFFKNFNPETDCIESGESDNPGTCTLKCRTLGSDGDEGIDCVESKWSELKSNKNNYSTTAPGVYPTTNPTQLVYTSDYKYTCWSYGIPVVKENSDGTKSVYISCPVVSEIVGTLKNSTTQARVKYHMINSASAEIANKNVKDSAIKTKVDNWYATSIYGKTDSNNNQLESYLSDEYFCNDRTSSSETFPFNENSTYAYNSTTRNSTTKDKVPSFKCPNLDNDAFTLKSSGAKSTVTPNTNGNNALTYPVGLITIDEYAYAGGVRTLMNYKSYLSGGGFWTMSPVSYDINSNLSRNFAIDANGLMSNPTTATSYRVRPVINLKADVLYESGSGTETDPYIISINK